MARSMLDACSVICVNLTEVNNEKLALLFGLNIFFSWYNLCLFLLPQITKQQLQQTKDRFQAFLNGDTQIVADEAFINAVQSYSEVLTTHPT